MKRIDVAWFYLTKRGPILPNEKVENKIRVHHSKTLRGVKARRTSGGLPSFPLPWRAIIVGFLLAMQPINIYLIFFTWNELWWSRFFLLVIGKRLCNNTWKGCRRQVYALIFDTCTHTLTINLTYTPPKSSLLRKKKLLKIFHAKLKLCDSKSAVSQECS